MIKKYVGKNGYPTITSALKSLPASSDEAATITLAPGIYREHLELIRGNLTLTGESPELADQTVITGDLGAKEILEDGIKRGTFRTQTVFIHANDVKLENLTIENTAGPGKNAGQAIALYADGDRLVFHHVRLLGNQDTLFTGPLPEKEIEPGGFRGPLEFAPRIPGRHFYRHCYIEGHIDFIFGGACAWFKECEIFARNPEKNLSCQDGQGEAGGEEKAQENHPLAFLTAASTPPGQKYGYVFHKCRLGGDCPAGSVYLGRPWRDHAKTVYLSCDMGSLIHPAGWDDWGKVGAYPTICYAEYDSSGAGAAPQSRALFSRQLTENEASAYTVTAVLSGEDHWNPINTEQ